MFILVYRRTDVPVGMMYYILSSRLFPDYSLVITAERRQLDARSNTTSHAIVGINVQVIVDAGEFGSFVVVRIPVQTSRPAVSVHYCLGLLDGRLLLFLLLLGRPVNGVVEGRIRSFDGAQWTNGKRIR
jgi:hypothetical protein